jgi:hypothetical protein
VSVSNQSEDSMQNGAGTKKSENFHNHPKATKAAMNQDFRKAQEVM